MLNNLQALTHDDLVVDGAYLYLSSDIGESLCLAPMIMLSEPNSEGMFRTKVDSSSGVEFLDREIFLESVGCPRGPRRFHDNHHRTFEDTPENRRVLEELVETQNVSAWLNFLGIEDVEAAIEQARQKEADFNALVRQTDHMVESGNILGPINLVKAVIEAKIVGTVVH